MLMWNDIQTFEGYLGLQEVLRNGHEAFKGRALGGPVSYEQIPALAERGRNAVPRSTSTSSRRGSARASSSPAAASRMPTSSGYVYLGFAARALGSDAAPRRAPRAEARGSDDRRRSARDPARELIRCRSARGSARHGTINGSPSCAAMNGSTR